MTNLEKALINVLIQQEKNIEHLKDGLLWIHEPAKIRLNHIKAVKTDKLEKLIDEHFKI